MSIDGDCICYSTYCCRMQALIQTKQRLPLHTARTDGTTGTSIEACAAHASLRFVLDHIIQLATAVNTMCAFDNSFVPFGTIDAFSKRRPGGTQCPCVQHAIQTPPTHYALSTDSVPTRHDLKKAYILCHAQRPTNAACLCLRPLLIEHSLF